MADIDTADGSNGYTTIGGPFGRAYIRNPLGYGTRQTINNLRH